MADPTRASQRSRRARPTLEPEARLLLEQLRNRTSKNLQASIERTDYYRQLLTALETMLRAVS